MTNKQLGIIAFFFGGLGVHHFLQGNTIRGLIYLFFCWTYIPSIIALFEAIVLLTKKE